MRAAAPSVACATAFPEGTPKRRCQRSWRKRFLDEKRKKEAIMETQTFQVEGSNITLTARLATNFWQRFRGLMLSRPLPPATGLLITPCNSIHMCFMRFAIDAVYLDKQGRILKITRHLRPWLGLSACWHAHSVLEMTAGQADALGLRVGQKFTIQETK